MDNCYFLVVTNIQGSWNHFSFLILWKLGKNQPNRFGSLSPTGAPGSPFSDSAPGSPTLSLFIIGGMSPWVGDEEKSNKMFTKFGESHNLVTNKVIKLSPNLAPQDSGSAGPTLSLHNRPQPDFLGAAVDDFLYSSSLQNLVERLHLPKALQVDSSFPISAFYFGTKINFRNLWCIGTI